MRFTITDAAEKPEWVDDMATFLHDSLVGDDPVWQGDRFTLVVQRLYYERPHLRKLLWVIPQCGWQWAPALLNIEPVTGMRDRLRRRRRDFPDVFLQMKLIRSGELEVETDRGRWFLSLGPEARITIEDTGPPEEDSMMWDIFGGPMKDPTILRILEGGEV